MSDRGVVRLQSSDGEVFMVEVEAARTSRMLATMLDDLGHEPDDVIPLPNVTGRLLKKVLAWIDHHLSKRDETHLPATPSITPTPPQPPLQPRLQSRVPQRPSAHTPPNAHTLTAWENDFVKKNKDELYELLLVANYLDIKALLDILCQTVAGVIKGKDPEVIRRAFNASTPHAMPSQHSQQVHTGTQEDSEPVSAIRTHKETSV